MKTIRTLTFSVIVVAAMGHIAFAATLQSSSNSSLTTGSGVESSTIALSIALPKEKIPPGAIPWVYLTVKNLTKETITYPTDRVHVEGEDGEPPTTLRQRQLTNRRNPNEPSLLGGGFEPEIEPGDLFTRKYDLSQLYDLSKPGKYKVYIEVSDEFHSNRGKGKWVRSPAVTFEILS